MDLLNPLKPERRRTKNAQLTVRLDVHLKKRAELRLEAMGMTATEAVEQL